MREIKYTQAINEAISQMMEFDGSIFVFGEGVDYNDGIFGSTDGLQQKFGKERVFDTPLAEDALTGICVGASIAGMRPVLVHARVDFLMLTMNQLVNHAAKWPYMCGGNIPILIRAIVGRGWGQGAQHSQSLQALFAHIPGLQVVMPVSPFDAKGLTISALKGTKPVISIEHRWLYDKIGEVPEEIYGVPIGKGKVIRSGQDVTIIAVSHMVIEAMEVANYLQDKEISVEVIDLRTVRPIDAEIICDSVRKTGRLLVVDNGWKACGISAEVAAIAAENVAECLKANIVRITLPDTPTPSSYVLENEYYPNSQKIVAAVFKILDINKSSCGHENCTAKDPDEKPFKGPF